LGRTFTGWIAPACGWRTYSITSSATASTPGGMVKPSDFAVFRLITISNLVGCNTGLGGFLAAGCHLHRPGAQGRAIIVSSFCRLRRTCCLSSTPGSLAQEL
jgi:hypothetical protein